MPSNPSAPHDEEISETHNPTHGESQQILRKRKREGPHEEENGEEQDIVGPDDAEEEGGRDIAGQDDAEEEDGGELPGTTLDQQGPSAATVGESSSHCPPKVTQTLDVSPPGTNDNDIYPEEFTTTPTAVEELSKAGPRTPNGTLEVEDGPNQVPGKQRKSKSDKEGSSADLPILKGGLVDKSAEETLRPRRFADSLKTITLAQKSGEEESDEDESEEEEFKEEETSEEEKSKSDKEGSSADLPIRKGGWVDKSAEETLRLRRFADSLKTITLAQKSEEEESEEEEFKEEETSEEEESKEEEDSEGDESKSDEDGEEVVDDAAQDIFRHLEDYPEFQKDIQRYKPCPATREIVNDKIGVGKEPESLLQWRKNLFPTIMTLVIQSYRRKGHSYSLEAIYLLRNLHSNYRDKIKQSLPRFIESKLAHWIYKKKQAGYYGIRFLHKQDEGVDTHLHSIQVSCRLANKQLSRWNSHLSNGSIMYEVRNPATIRENSWERLNILTLHYLLMKYMFHLALDSSLSKEDETCILSHSHDLMVAKGKNKKECIKLCFLLSTIFTVPPQKDDRIDNQMILAFWRKREHQKTQQETTMQEAMKEFYDYLLIRFEGLEDDELADIITGQILSLQDGYLQHKNNGLSMGYKVIHEREKYKYKSKSKSKQTYDKRSMDEVWWEFLTVQSSFMYLRSTYATSGLKDLILDKLGIKSRGGKEEKDDYYRDD